MTIVAKNSSALKKRLIRFFEKVPDNRRPISAFVRRIEEHATVYVFGGLIRDICLHGIEHFNSDVDLVVRVKNRKAFDDVLSSYDFDRNKFGGYRINVSRWLIDIWEFDNTWAFVEGLVNPVNDRSLLETTFFSWDAIFYDIKNRKLSFQEDYFLKMGQKILDLNLNKNPNEFGAFVRALRLVAREQAGTGKELSEFIINRLKITPDEEILRYEKQHFRLPYLNDDLLETFRNVASQWHGQIAVNWVAEKQSDMFGIKC